MKKRHTIVLYVVFMLFSTTACGATFKGKVIDADTKKPIEGAVVVATWRQSTNLMVSTGSKIYDIKEILTDKNGEWKLRGPKGDFFIAKVLALIPWVYYTKAPQFIVYKPGYCSWPKGFSVEACQGKIKPGGNSKVAKGELVELPKLTKREDRLRTKPGPVTGYLPGEDAWEKQKEFIRMLNKENNYLGLKGGYKIYEQSKNKR